jgi:co-chaperonin GroES (HSP10)
MLNPLGNTVLFSFLDDTGGQAGTFTERTRTGLIIPKLQSTQKGERWATVTAVGPDVVGLSPGDFILIEPLMWTRHVVFEGEKVWKTNTDKIIMATKDINLTIQY